MSSENEFSSDKQDVFTNSSHDLLSESTLSPRTNSGEENHLKSSKNTNHTDNNSVESGFKNNNEEESMNPYELWHKKFNERIELLKAKEAEEIENRTKVAAAELEQWHKDRKKQIEETLKKLLPEEPTENETDRNQFDWITAAKYIESSEFFAKDQSSGQNQKLIEMIMKKKQILEKSNNQPK